MQGLLHLAVSHHVVALTHHVAHPLEIQMVMIKAVHFMTNSRGTLTSVPVAVLLILDHLVHVNGLITVIEGFYDLSAVCYDREK